MIKSMTAFSREVGTGEAGELVWEVRSVNHRFLEPSIRLPEDLRRLEPAVRERLGVRLQRGKVDCQLRYVARPGALGSLRVNHHLLAQLVAAADEVAQAVGTPATPHAYDLLRWPGVLEESQQDLDAVMTEALALLESTLDGLVAAREREGARLGELLRERCDHLDEQVALVRRRLPEVLAQARQRLLDRLAEVRAELDPSRLEQEMALLAQRLDVAEEMDRLAAHVAEVRDVLGRRGPLGRRLDFLMQELNREANTLGSKSADVETTRAAVEMKVLIEQMREQVQNLE
ncbi:YicC/YloC family endoribonuclease [Thiococcus pfennigii]|jgi:uncharacterized protein (TIGR00255 family)|uniref:YicC/YloC family endoribonuclease n=1 Tax=Thiococcus pfennigii TaxID=1057 RepID=UPI00190758B1|nr:YicC/YloC family endoribonuclease [Thiococcus pfennigii]MBK1700260.1 YicC family protein [Thiococcus pfennigii]MBK1730407.1 YicC family protein [Thiococcus pfennigii]